MKTLLSALAALTVAGLLSGCGPDDDKRFSALEARVSTLEAQLIQAKQDAEKRKNEGSWIEWQTFQPFYGNGNARPIQAFDSKEECETAAGQWTVTTKAVKQISVSPNTWSSQTGTQAWTCFPRGVSAEIHR